jgi:hypothetical protein
MKKLSALLLGLVTLWPILYIFIFMAFMFSQFMAVPMGQYSGPEKTGTAFLLSSFGIIFSLHILTMMVIFGLLIYYIYHVFHNTAISQDKKALWAVVIFMGNMIAMPVYWFLYIWRQPKMDPLVLQSNPPDGSQPLM